MDEVDRKILLLLAANARMTVKEIASKVSLTSPAVSERIRRLEASGVIVGYTVRANPDLAKSNIRALVSISVLPPDRPAFFGMLAAEETVEECYQVTGTYSHMVKVRCRDIVALEQLLSRIQKMGQTNTQIILSSTPGGALPL